MAALLSVSLEDRIEGDHVKVSAYERFVMVAVHLQGHADRELTHYVGDVDLGVGIPAHLEEIVASMVDRATGLLRCLVEGTV